MRTLSSLSFLTGIIILIFTSYLVIQRVNPYKLSFQSVPQMVTNNSSKLPVRVIIDDLKIDVSVKQATQSGKRWPLYSDAITYLSNSSIPGQKGNSILYGHNWNNLLGRLTQAKVGQKINVYFSDGTKKTFQTKYIQEVSPTQVDILGNSNDSRITLYTCSGFLDTKRFVVVASLI